MLKFILLTVYLTPAGNVTTVVEEAPSAVECRAQLDTNVRAISKRPGFVLRHAECYPPAPAK